MVAIALTLLFTQSGAQKVEKPVFTFNKQEYVYRYSKGSLTEYTPKGKPDLKKFVDMVTVNYYPNVKTGEDLANVASNVVELYKEHKGTILVTDSVPRTEKKEAEHLAVVSFNKAEFSEVSFARFMIAKNRAFSIVYSHRSYGKDAAAIQKKWLAANGENCEKALMALKGIQ